MQIELNELTNVRGIGKKTIQRIREYKLKQDNYISEYNPELHLDRNSVNKGDCLELMNGIPDKSVDMILADLPYGTTACSWDSVINLDKLWLQYERIIKDNGAIVLTSSEPFSTILRSSNLNLYRYDWVWLKDKGTNILDANRMPMKNTEYINVFYKHLPTYNPQMRKGNPYKKIQRNSNCGSHLQSNEISKNKINKTGERYPLQSIYFARDSSKGSSKHPTQKPVALFEYLIKTYTNKGDLILDNVAGSGTTGVACQNTNRDYILIEKENKYIDIINERIVQNTKGEG